MSSSENKQESSAPQDRREAFMRLYMTHESKIRGYVLCKVNNWTDTDDIMQEAVSVMMKKFQGFAKLSLRQGAQVIVQAPCVFDLRSPNGMVLQSGTVTAQVPPEAQGFVVKTPSSTVTDFGTEFGVQVKEPAEAEVHVFDGHGLQFPPTRGGWNTELAHAGAPDLREDPPAALRMDGQIYGMGNHPALLMHANIGITFDLDAMREDLGATRIAAFTSLCGVSEHLTNIDNPQVIFYVLVDGQERFHQKIGKQTHPAVRIRVELSRDDRFLTLACLAGEENAGDWSFFGDPALELGHEPVSSKSL